MCVWEPFNSLLLLLPEGGTVALNGDANLNLVASREGKRNQKTNSINKLVSQCFIQVAQLCHSHVRVSGPVEHSSVFMTQLYCRDHNTATARGPNRCSCTLWLCHCVQVFLYSPVLCWRIGFCVAAIMCNDVKRHTHTQRARAHNALTLTHTHTHARAQHTHTHARGFKFWCFAMYPNKDGTVLAVRPST